MVLIGRYSQREFQIIVLVFKDKFYSLFPWIFHLFKQQVMIYNYCRPMRRHHDQRSFLSFLQWWILILVSHTRIFQQVLLLISTLFPECKIPSDLLKWMFWPFFLYQSRYRYSKTRQTIYAGLGKMIFWKELDMYKTRIMRPSADKIDMIMQRERMPATGAYATVKSTSSRMDDLYTNILEYREYWFSM